MLGPFNLRYLHLFVKDKSAGAFILSRDGKSADFVGSSGEDVATALGRLTRSRYQYFWFAYASSGEEAASLQMSWYHRYRPADSALPAGDAQKQHWRCTVAGCAACALAQSRR